MAVPVSALQSEVISTTGASTLLDRVVPLTGSPTALVYARIHQLAAGASGIGADGGRENEFDAEIETRDLDGHTTRVGHYSDAHFGWSLVGQTLTADVTDGDGHPTADVDWWDIVTRAHGTIHLAAGHVYLGAGPAGVIYGVGDALRLHTITGVVSTLGSPFAEPVAFLAVGEDGLVASDRDGHASAMAYATPGAFTPLDTATTDIVACRAVSSTYAACNSGSGDDDNDSGVPSLVPDATMLVPLDGSPPTTSTDCPGRAALAGDTLMWAGGCGTDTVYSLTAGAATPDSADAAIQTGLVSGDGLGAGATPRSTVRGPGEIDPRSTSIVGFTDAAHSTIAVPERPSPITVDAFDVTPGGVTWADDGPTTGQPGARVRTMTRRLTTTSDAIVTGSPKRIAAGSGVSQVVPNLVAASSTASVYADHYAAGETVTLHVVSPFGNATIAKAVAYGHVLISGDRLIFQRIVSGDTHVDQYDLATGKTTVVRVIHDRLDASSTAIWGDYLAYATPHGWVYRTDLRTGKTIKVATGNKQRYYGDISVYVFGDWVGWHSQRSDAVGASDVDRIRNVRTMAPAINLGHTLWSLTSAGALMDDEGTQVPAAGSDGTLDATAFWLRSYAGHVRKVLSSRHFVTGPRLVGRTLAWADASGVLRAKVVDVTVPRPWSLGSSIAPTTFKATAGKTWTMATPYSLALSRCSVALTRNGSTVRVLACSASGRKDGLATVTWDGKDGHGRTVPAGTYRWSIHASGTAGAALDSGGRSSAVTGTVTLRR